MSNSIKLTLYTQYSCNYCDHMKMDLDKWGYNYDVINISEDTKAKEFMRSKGHKTVPQLYWNKTHLNTVSTIAFTKEILETNLDLDNYTGGVEMWK